MSTPLTGADRRVLRALGNALKPTVFVGKDGVSEEVLGAIDSAHRTAELVKLKVLDTCPLHRKEVGEELAGRSGSDVVQVLGRTVLLYRRDPEKPKISLPSAPLPDPPEE
jgi:RNA-binding protein